MENKINDTNSFNTNPKLEDNTFLSLLKMENSLKKDKITFNKENHSLSSSHSSHETHFTQRKSAFKLNFSKNIVRSASKNNSKYCFEIIKELKTTPHYDNKKNYYFEYWNIFQENELILEKIKESSAEIHQMKNKMEMFKVQE